MEKTQEQLMQEQQERMKEMMKDGAPLNEVAVGSTLSGMQTYEKKEEK